MNNNVSVYYSDKLSKIYYTNRQTEVDYLLKAGLRYRIYTILCQTLSESIDVYLIGSSLTGYGSRSSDCDLCLILYDSNGEIERKYDQKYKTMGKLIEINKLLMASGIANNGQVIPAQTPILKFIDRQSGIEVNININRTVTIRNTHLMHVYSAIDFRVRPLILAIKLLARENGIHSAYNKTFNGYSISLMVIHFLQTACDPPVLPCLQKDYPQIFCENLAELRLGESTLSKINFKSLNNEELGALFLKFLDYYSNRVNMDKVISVRTASYRDKSEYVEKNGNQRHWKSHLCIEEPFDRSNTSYALHDIDVYRNIIETFKKVYEDAVSCNLRLERLDAKNSIHQFY